MRLVLAILDVLLANSARGQTYPSKPILMLVPLQAASAVDNAARLVAQRMAENMGQPIVVENQPGAAGLIGTERVAKGAPHGYTICGGHATPPKKQPPLQPQPSRGLHAE